MENSSIQQELFATIKGLIPSNVSAVDEIAKVLEVSSDSVYRRMRGEKTISLDELQALCSHYKISLDQLMNIRTGGFMFQGNFLNSKTYRYDAYLSNMLMVLSMMNSFKKKEFYLLCKDVPIFYHFQFPEIAAFKYFFWMKSLFHFPEFTNQKFNFNSYKQELLPLGEKILDAYNELPCFELWNIENVNSTIRQIEFYREGQIFESDEDVLKLYEAWEKVVDHIEKQAELGYKFKYGDAEMKPMGSYQVYINEVVMGDNSMIALLDGVKLALMPHTVINYMTTRDMVFCENLFDYVQSVMKRSTLISKVSEKERAKFFRLLKDRISRRKDTLKV